MKLTKRFIDLGYLLATGILATLTMDVIAIASVKSGIFKLGRHQIGPHPTGTVATAGALVRSPGLDRRIPFRRGWAGPQATVALPPLQAGAETSPRWGKPRRGEAPVLPGLSIRWPLPLHDFEPHVPPIRDGESNRLFGGFAREHGADRIPGVVCLYADDMERGLAGLKLAGFVHEKTGLAPLPSPGFVRAAAFAAAVGETEDSTRVATAGFEESMSKSQVKPGSQSTDSTLR